VSNIGIGIESLSDETRKDFKKQTSDDIIDRSIEAFHTCGFSVTGLFIVGYDTEDLGCFEEIQKFIDRSGIEKWRVSPLCQTPEVPDQFLPMHRTFLWNELDRFGRDLADYTNGEFVFIFPRKMKPSSLQENIETFNSSVCSWRRTLKFYLGHKRLRPVVQRIGNNISQKIVQKEVLKSNYIQMLKELETPFYGKTEGGWMLKEDLLAQRFKKNKIS